MSREEEIERQAREIFSLKCFKLNYGYMDGLREMAKWADKNPVSETFIYSDQHHKELEDKLALVEAQLKKCKEALEFIKSYECGDCDFAASEVLDKIKEMEKVK